MKEDARYIVIKDIPMKDGKSIIKGRVITRTHGCYFLDGGLLSQSFQEDFDSLIEYEEKHGWNYLNKIHDVNYKAF